MSDLTSSLATLAERLGTPPGTTRAPGGVGEGASAAGAVDLMAILAMPLDQFAREGQCLEARVSWHTETLWFVPDERDAAALGREGVSRGRVWTARELAALMALSDQTLTTARTLALAKCAIDGDIVEVRAR
jgi:hypothetical protein